MRESRCVILGKNSSTYWLKTLLDHDFNEIEIVESDDQLDSLRPSPAILAVLGTDTYPGAPLGEALERLQRRLAPRLMLCLVDSLDAATEVKLRCLGLCFLGSYTTFIKHAENLLAKAMERAPLFANDMIQTCPPAQRPENSPAKIPCDHSRTF